MEYELLDTGIFNDDRYFDVFVEYAKGGPEDLLVQITAVNRGPEAAELHIFPLCGSGTTGRHGRPEPAEKPKLKQIKGPKGPAQWRSHMRTSASTSCTATARCRCSLPRMKRTMNGCFLSIPIPAPYVKDGINNYVVNGQGGSRQSQPKPAPRSRAHYRFEIGPGQSATVSVRLSRPECAIRHGHRGKGVPSSEPTFEQIMKDRLEEADEFYRAVTPPIRES